MQSFEYTLCMIKPDAVNHLRQINQMIKENGLSIITSSHTQLTKVQAQSFYEEHRGKPFYEGLTSFMSSGPIYVQILKGENVIQKYRDLMGKTNSAEAEKGTIRHRFGNKENMTENAVHGSDSIPSAKREINFFFNISEQKDVFTLKNEFRRESL